MSDDVRLTTFHPRLSDVVAGWATSPEEAQSWCASTSYPVAPETVAAWAGDDVHAFVLERGGVPVAYGELWIDDEECEVELARLIVAPGERGRGVGRTLVAGLVRRASATPHADAFMRVLPSNAAALRCYEGAGFTRVSDDEASAFNRGQPRAYVWLRRSLRPN